MYAIAEGSLKTSRSDQEEDKYKSWNVHAILHIYFKINLARHFSSFLKHSNKVNKNLKQLMSYLVGLRTFQ